LQLETTENEKITELESFSELFMSEIPHKLLNKFNCFLLPFTFVETLPHTKYTEAAQAKSNLMKIVSPSG